MQFKNYNVYFFFLILAGITVLTYFISAPFIIPFLIAGILAYLFSPIYDFFLKLTNRKGFASFLACLAIALIIIVPLLSIAYLVINESQNIISNISYNPDQIRQTANDLLRSLSALPFAKPLGLDKIGNGDVLITLVKNLSQYTLVIFQGIYQGVAHFIFVVFIMFFSLFYLFIDGRKLMQKLIGLSPLQDKYDRLLIEKFSSIVRATIKGTTLIAIIQGFLSGVLFWATGVPSPIILGILAAISSVIPSVGSGLIWAPVGIVMLLLGNFAQGITILLFGGVVISTVDNFLRPKLVGKDTQLHPLLILFSSIGGISLFGISGFLIGPIVMSLFVAMWDIYALEFKGQLEDFNK